MTKFLLIALFAVNFLYADKINEMSIACPDKQELLNIPEEVGKDYVKLNQYAISKNCLFLMPGDIVQVLDYTGHTSDVMVQIMKNGKTYYVQHKAVIIEQSGNKNSYKF